MKTTPLKIGKRTFALCFNLNAMRLLEERIPDFDLRKMSDYVKTPNGMLDLIVALAQEGELLENRELDVDREWFGRYLTPSPKQIALVKIAVMNAITEGLTMETEDDDDGERDVVLEDIKKKEQTGG